jgi:hypothetical protein
MLEGEVQTKASHQPNTELGFLTGLLCIPEIRNLFLNSLSVCLSVLWLVLRVFSKSHYRPTASTFRAGLLTIAAEAFHDFSSVSTGEYVGSVFSIFRDHDSVLPDRYLLRIHNHLYDKRT